MSKAEKEKKYPNRKHLTEDEIKELQIARNQAAKANNVLVFAEQEKKNKEHKK